MKISNLPEKIDELLLRLEGAGFAAYIVGGFVRDSIMNIESHDFDVATSAAPKEVERVFSDCRVIETGIKHGTVTVLFGEYSVEVTTFRVESGYSDHRHPDSVSFSGRIEDDLSRRDFTMNGIAVNPRLGTVDPFGGRKDIEDGIIRCIGDPKERFSEDPLRILRAVRFSATLGFSIEEKTAAAVHEMKDELKSVSKERIFAELTRLLCGKHVRKAMMEFPEIFCGIVPYLELQINYDQHSKYHNSVLYEHTARAVESAPADPALRLAMLFHDTGKPFRRTIDENDPEIWHYAAHADESTRIAEEILREYKCPNALRERVCAIVRYHDIPVDLSKKAVKRALARYGFELYRDVMLAHTADDNAKADFVKPRIQDELKAIEIAEQIERERPCFTLKDLAVSGRDLLKFAEESPAIGKTLRALLDEVVEEKLPNEKQALLERAAELLKKG